MLYWLAPGTVVVLLEGVYNLMWYCCCVLNICYDILFCRTLEIND